jgi:hypothetical protein
MAMLNSYKTLIASPESSNAFFNQQRFGTKHLVLKYRIASLLAILGPLMMLVTFLGFGRLSGAEFLFLPALVLLIPVIVYGNAYSTIGSISPREPSRTITSVTS